MNMSPLARWLCVCLATLSIVMPARIFASDPVEDSVVGSGAAGFGTFVFDAHSGPGGENATGTVSFSLAIGTLEGQVTHLCASGSQAVIVATKTGGTIEAPSFAVHVWDERPLDDGTTMDQIRLELYGDVVSFCTGFAMISPAGVEDGGLVVTDAPAIDPPPPSPTVEEQLENLKGQVRALHTEGVLTSGQSAALLAKLNAAGSSLETERRMQAVRQLRAFLKQVEAYMAANILSEVNGQPLIEAATMLIADIDNS